MFLSSYLEEKGLARLNEVWVVEEGVGGVVSRVCLKLFLRLGLLVMTCQVMCYNKGQ